MDLVRKLISAFTLDSFGIKLEFCKILRFKFKFRVRIHLKKCRRGYHHPLPTSHGNVEACITYAKLHLSSRIIFNLYRLLCFSFEMI